MRILFVEDERELNDLGTMIMESGGHNVHQSFSLAEAREAYASSGPFDLIIADQTLPDGLGIDFLLKIREKHPDQPMAVVSAFLNSHDRDSVGAARIPAFLKPINYLTVLNEVASGALGDA